MSTSIVLRDGREMAVRQAAVEDGDAIAQEHPLPRDRDASETVYRNYYLAKALTYIRAPGAGVTTGWVGDELAGFVFQCNEITSVRRFTKSPGTMAWFTCQAVAGRFGYDPRVWLDLMRWGLQHFRQPRDYDTDHSSGAYSDIAAWIGTVHTVPTYRRLGVATSLLGAVEGRLAGSGASEVALWVAEDNVVAKELYEGLGYAPAGSYQRVGETCELMVKALDTEPSHEPKQPG